MKVLAVGDIVGEAGVRKLKEELPKIKREENIDFVITNGENSAGLLALVVLYNLLNSNISERIRELATIKVLGFYDREVYEYIGRETIILTILGMLVGLVGGY